MYNDRIIYSCNNASCRHPIYTGKCLDECWRRYGKELGLNEYSKRTMGVDDTRRKDSCVTTKEL